ncbi:MAG TPA: hypothetical protein VGW40_14185 [Allosphingosinicella sp.]|nr:hypothetical protein [Allosphingosinicella sp.]
MIGRIVILGTLLAAAPAAAKPTTPAGETSIPRISGYLDWRPDGNQALLIQGDTGRWYRATLSAPCPRLLNRTGMRFIGSPGNRFDRNSAINADGWRCLVDSVTRADPPRRR